MNSIAVVIVNYNTREILRRCLASIHEEEALEIIVIDNASSDGSAEMVRSCYPHVTLWAKSVNVGYGAAANEAIMLCDADAILLLNSDTLLQKFSARRLLNYLDCHPRAAIAGPRLLHGDGALQPSCYPDPPPLNIFLEESSLGRLITYLPGIRNLYLRTWRHDKARVVPWVLGAALAIRRDAFVAVQGFDAEYFMYFEEVDLCHRLRAAGWQIQFAPVTTVVHFGGASTNQLYAEMQSRLFASLQLFYHRYYTDTQLYLLRLSMSLIAIARLMRDALRYSRSRDSEARKQSWAALQVRFRMLGIFLFPLLWSTPTGKSSRIVEGGH